MCINGVEIRINQAICQEQERLLSAGLLLFIFVSRKIDYDVYLCVILFVLFETASLF